MKNWSIDKWVRLFVVVCVICLAVLALLPREPMKDITIDNSTSAPTVEKEPDPTGETAAPTNPPGYDKWLEMTRNGTFKVLVDKNIAAYKEQRMSHTNVMTDKVYSPFGDYLTYTSTDYSSAIKDSNGMVMAEVNGKQIYSPATTITQALSYYGKSLSGEISQEDFLKVADFLLTMQDQNGQFLNNYDYSYYVNRDKYYKAGWASAENDGKALSVFARAYHLTKDKKYEDAAQKVLLGWERSVDRGGIFTSLAALNSTLDDFVFYEGYPCDSRSYTLSSMAYALIGLYDWSCAGSSSSELAKKYFELGVKGLEKALPYYDLGGFTAYDLTYVTLGTGNPMVITGYHRYHIAFCKILYDITRNKVFNDYYKLWVSYVQ